MLHRNFSHIYVERDVAQAPEVETMLGRFRSANIIEIDSYKQVFNRPRQDFQAQKSSQKLILAKRREQFFYPGSPMSLPHGFKHFYYNTLAMNCLFDCEYCYLQGLYPSANLVLFVNNQDYFTATQELLKEHSPLFLCISYDTDLLSLETFLPYSRLWIEFARANPDLTIEIRTKSAAIAPILELAPIPNVVLAWTLSPNEVAQSYEHGTAAPRKRIEAAGRALAAGWKVRLCIDPIIYVDNWESKYEELIKDLRRSLALDKVHDISLGTLRVNPEQFKKMSHDRFQSDLWRAPYTKGPTQVTYPPELRSLMTGKIAEFLESEGVSVVTRAENGLSI